MNVQVVVGVEIAAFTGLRSNLNLLCLFCRQKNHSFITPRTNTLNCNQRLCFIKFMLLLSLQPLPRRSLLVYSSTLLPDRRLRQQLGLCSSASTLRPAHHRSHVAARCPNNFQRY